VVTIQAESTTIRNPENGAEKTFTFDHALHSSSAEEKGDAIGEAEREEQLQVYTCVGQTTLDSALMGYNACVFAYGQTGSGLLGVVLRKHRAEKEGKKTNTHTHMQSSNP
jgi:hypothetical protein